MSVRLAHVAGGQCLAPGRVDAPTPGGQYRSLFDELPALQVDEEVLHELGRPGGPCDLGVDVAEDSDSHVAAVWPFFGQFVAHDITADRSPLAHHADPARLTNFRVPRANLESLYGTGPVGSPYLYTRDDPAKLLLSLEGSDVPRNHEGIALVGDPRNDVQLFTSQMSVAFIRLHNRLVDRLRDERTAEPDVFNEARRAATWHYQHVILREFLPGLIGARADRRAARRRAPAVSHRPRPLHPVRVRRRRLPLRPRPDPRPLPGQRTLRPVPGVPRSDGLRSGRS